MIPQRATKRRGQTLGSPPLKRPLIAKRDVEDRVSSNMSVAIGADHGGFTLKAALLKVLQGDGFEVADLGTHSPKPCDYPRVAYKVAQAVAEGRFDRGVLLCKSGIGVAIAANKVPGIRAAVCHDRFDAKRSRAHNDANVLVMGAEKLTSAQASRLLRVWLATRFESGTRHERRVRQIASIERHILSRTPVTRHQ